MNVRLFDLLLAAAVAIGAIGIALLDTDIAMLQVLVAVPLVLLLPGYTLIAVTMSSSALSRSERIALSVGISLGVAALGGFLLDTTPWGLRAGTWTVLLGSITLVNCIGATIRRRHDASRYMTIRSGISVGQAALLGLAFIVLVGALQVSRIGATDPQKVSFTQLWLLPAHQDNHSAVQIGINNMELATTHYRLVLEIKDHVIQEWPTIDLAPQQQWLATTLVLPKKSGEADLVEALLYREDAPGIVYRRATLELNTERQ